MMAPREPDFLQDLLLLVDSTVGQLGRLQVQWWSRRT